MSEYYVSKSLETRVIREDGDPDEWTEHETDSITQAFGAIYFAQISQSQTPPQVTSVTGSDFQLVETTRNFRSVNVSNPRGPGIVFGAGTDPVEYDDADLASRFISGVNYSNGQASITQTSTATDVEVERTLGNTSGSDIVAREAGHVANGQVTGGGAEEFLIARDVLDEEIRLGPTESLQGRYTWSFPV
jgi:hypothetical protein